MRNTCLRDAGKKRENKKNSLEGEETSLCDSQGLALGKGKVESISEGSGYEVDEASSLGLEGSQDDKVDVLSLGLTHGCLECQYSNQLLGIRE